MEYIKEIFAQYTQSTIRVYQAYNHIIAQEAISQKAFGEHFNTNRMTWIKPSFLWMMYRSNWGQKKDQENILAIDIQRSVFEQFLQQAVLTSPKSSAYSDSSLWKKEFSTAQVYCQWDPDKNKNGNPIAQAAIQIGLKQDALKLFLSDAIVEITDMTPLVIKWRNQKNKGQLNSKDLPSEKIYPLSNPLIRKRLGMK